MSDHVQIRSADPIFTATARPQPRRGQFLGRQPSCTWPGCNWGLLMAITMGISHIGWEKNGKTGKLGQDRLEVRWEAVMFLFNLVI